jgi:quercetin dioxygenase-like cupin family protein|tara:strand:- start:412 stop:975 length:564 start_codon:yes stop_codon:yes gene_type:complete
MKNDIKALRQYAKLKKLPGVIKLGTISNKLCNQLCDLAKHAEITNERSIENRQGTYGVEHDNTSPAGKTYNQKHIDNLTIDIEWLHIFKEKYNWRFAELEPQGIIPMHLDDPYSYRFLAVINGNHIFSLESPTNQKIIMNTGDVYFVNSAHKHSVENTAKDLKRVALLGEMKINEHNTKLLRARAGR